MKICYASDLHFEFHENEPGWLPSLPKECDVMILAGDIGIGEGAIDAVFRIAEELPDTPVIFVSGNHEFYHTSIDKQLDRFKQAFEGESHIHFLENDTVEIKGYRFLGCTLWTGFDLLGKDNIRPAIVQAERYIADFQVIRDRSGSQVFHPVSTATRYRESRQWLHKQLNLGDADKTVVVTHFPPCREARHQKIPEDLLSAYFQANCFDMIEQFQPAAWIYGHNHYSLDIQLGSTRVTSNQLGYPNEQGYIPTYNPLKALMLKG